MQKIWFGKSPARPGCYAFGVRSLGITFDVYDEVISFCIWYRKSKDRLGYKYGSIKLK